MHVETITFPSPTTGKHLRMSVESDKQGLLLAEIELEMDGNTIRVPCEEFLGSVARLLRKDGEKGAFRRFFS